jgi:putative DNA primase/helicase
MDAEIEKELMLTKEKEKQYNTEFNFNKAIFQFADYYDMANQFLKIQPMYYNEKKLWWAWNHTDKCWRFIDEIDILNIVNVKIHGLKLFESKQKNEILTALQMQSRLNAPKEAPDSWLQFKGNIFDYKTGKCFEATPDYFITNPIPFDLGKTEDTPILDQWITEWVGEKWKPTIYEIIAFSCVSNYKINRIFCLNGEGRNGKSTLLHIIRNFVGKKNCCSSSMDTILSRPFESAKLFKKLVCEMGEINSGIFRKTELIKKLVGSDTIGFEFKGKDGFDGYNYAKIIIATNKLPETTDKTTGFYSKWIIIDFLNRFKENPNFLDALPEVEYNNLAKKCLRIISELMTRGEFTNEGSPEEKALRYEEKSSPFNDFIKLEMVSDTNSQTPFFQIYKEYEAYCEQRTLRKPSKVEVSRILKSKGFSETVVKWSLVDSRETTVRAYIGLKFKEDKNIEPDKKELGLNAF